MEGNREGFRTGRMAAWPLVLVMLIVGAGALNNMEKSVYSISDIQRVTEAEEFISEEEICDSKGHARILNSFTWADYLVLGGMLAGSVGIGAVYSCSGGKTTSSSDLLLGGGSVPTLPMAISLCASFVTAVELLGNPAEMYRYGTQFWLVSISLLLVVPLTSRLYLPVFWQLKLTSAYEYLELRFGPRTRRLASALYVLQMALYTSVAVYAPALALSHVTGLNVYVAVSIVYVVCIFYASQGGLRAVIMTDTFQAAVLMGSILLIVYLGEGFLGGPGPIWSTNFKTDRLELFNMDTNPTVRHTFWSVLIGGTFYWMTMFCSNQASIQKYMSVGNIAQVRKALWLSCGGLILVYTINFYTGMILVTHYKDCDPLRSGDVTAADELLPLYVISQMGHLQGVTGFFVAGIFAASLGTVASALNSLAAVTYQDFVIGAFNVKVSESKSALWVKSISIVYGIISFLLVFVVEQLGSVMQVAISFNGMVGGVTFALFTLGMFFPWTNSKGAISGGVAGLALVLWMGLGQQVSIASGIYIIPEKPTSIQGCPCLNLTEATNEAVNSDESEVFFLYRVSFLWYSVISFCVTVIVGIIVSYLTGPTNPEDVDSDLLSPPIRNYLYTLPEHIKLYLNLPPNKSPSCRDDNITKVGIINVAMEIKDELEKK